MEIIGLAVTLGIFYFTFKVVLVVYGYFHSRIKGQQQQLEKKDIYAILALAVLLVIGFTFFPAKDVTGGLLAGLVICALYGLMLLVIDVFVYISTRAAVKQQRIEKVTKTGFKLVKGTTTKHFYWSEIQTAHLDTKNMKLTLREKSKLVVSADTPNFYLLLKNMPIGYSDLDYGYIKSFFSSLEPCLVCGAIALREQKCLACGCSTWNASLKENYPTYEAYIKENQLEIFATMEPDEKFCDFKSENIGFEFDATWKPMVSKEEVLAYSEKEFWDLK